MKLAIIDQDTGNIMWRAVDCADYCGVRVTTWNGYVAAGRTPKPVAHLDKRTPVWDPEEIRAWHANRPGSPVKNHPKAKRD